MKKLINVSLSFVIFFSLMLVVSQESNSSNITSICKSEINNCFGKWKDEDGSSFTINSGGSWSFKDSHGHSAYGNWGGGNYGEFGLYDKKGGSAGYFECSGFLRVTIFVNSQYSEYRGTFYLYSEE